MQNGPDSRPMPVSPIGAPKKTKGPRGSKSRATATLETTPDAGAAEISIPDLQIRIIELPIIGVTPLITHRFDEKKRKQMEDRQQGAAKAKRKPKVPEEEYRASLYIMSGGGKGQKERYGFPGVAFKKAMVSACRHVDGIPMTVARGAFHVVGQLVEIEGTPHMRTDVVRLETGVADIRYRAEFEKWRARIIVRYLPGITPERLVHLLNVAGFSVGIGERRPEKSGDNFGQFQVDTTQDIKTE